MGAGELALWFFFFFFFVSYVPMFPCADFGFFREDDESPLREVGSWRRVAATQVRHAGPPRV